MRHLLIIIVPILLINCRPVNHNDADKSAAGYSSGMSGTAPEVLRVDISKPESKAARVNISDYCQSVLYIPLETNDRCLIKKIQKVEFILPYLLVATTKDVFVFDMDGKFIRQIGKAGNGPGEYNVISDICVRKRDTSIYIASTMNRRILQYSFDGELLDSFTNPYPYPVGLLSFGNETIYLSYNDYVTVKSGEKILSLASFDSGMNLKREYFPTMPGKEKTNVTLLLPDVNLYNLGGSIRFKQVRNDTLFEVAGHKMNPLLIFDLGDKKMPLEEFNYESFARKIYGGKYILFEKLVETQDRVFFTYKYDNRLIRSIYSKKERTLSEALFAEAEYNLTDDLNYGLPFWPEYLSRDNYLVGFLYPALLTKEQLENVPCSGTYVSESDNPVIQLAKLK